MSTEVNALADAFRLINLGILLGFTVGIGIGYIGHDLASAVRRILERRALRIDPRDVL